MRLKAVEMQGFKSFPDKTKITFERGVTAIIGPNGSGKSNISDAIRWVLGEMSMKSLRGSKMEDVIFNGTPARPALNCATVSLIIDTEDEYRAAHQETLEEEVTEEQDDKPRLSDAPETVVTRRYYRSGESEYSINKKQSRLRDIYDLFYNTGIGREGYSVIGQGKIAEVLSQKGDERRSIFEEAAGISRFRYQKTTAERKLEETENNLLRVNDILAEVASRVKPLEKEAENAKAYLVLSEEKKGLEITLWLDRLDVLREKRDLGEAGLRNAREALANAELAEQQAEQELDRQINEGYECSRQISVEEQNKAAAERTKAEAESEKAVCSNDISHFNQLIAESLAAISDAEAQTTLSATLISSAEKELEEARKAVEIVDASCTEKETIWSHARETVTQLTAEAETAEQSLAKIRTEVSEQATKEAALRAELEAAKRSAAESDERIAAGKERIAQLEQTVHECEAKRDAAEEEYLSELQVGKAAREKNKKALADEAELREQVVTIRLKLTAAEQKRENLQRMEQLFEGYSDSVRTVMKDGNEGKIRRKTGDSVVLHGPVSNILSADNEYVIALETALGASTQFIVVESAEDAKACIRYLKENHAGRATFLPLDTVRGSVCDTSRIEKMDGFVGIASNLAQYQKQYTGIVTDLLGKTVIATDIDKAQQLASATGYKVKIVTLDGQVIHPGGSFTGGSTAKKVGVFTRAMDIERLSSEIREFNAELLKIERNASHLHTDAEAYEAAALESDEKANEKKALYDACENDVNGYLVRIEEEKAHIEATERGKEAGDGDRTELEARLEECIRWSQESGRLMEDAEATNTEAKAKLENARQAESASFETLSQERIVQISKRAQADGVSNQLTQLTANLAGIVERINNYRVTVQASENSKKEREERIAAIGERLTGIQAEIDRADAKLADLFGTREAQEEKLNAVRNAHKEQQQKREDAFVKVTNEENNFQHVTEEFDVVTGKLWDEYEMTYSDAEAFRLPAEKMEKAQTRLASLKAKIRSMGVINVNAVEEYRATKERFDFLSTQVEDLQKTRRSLDSTIAKLETEMKDSFVDTFGKINEEFNHVFQELFEGGSAKIEMVDPENPLESGIDIILKPPGKSVKSISLLSGGEQSFAAIALYLALQNVNPAPFCIFDEIESALDEINVSKFAEYIRSHSQKTQYITITHRRGTMECADTLYGVTMHQKGVSDYLKLNLNRMEENIKEYTK